LLHQCLLMLTVIAVLLKLLADLTLVGGVVAQPLRQLLQLACKVGTSQSAPSGRSCRCPAAAGSLAQECCCLLILVFQRLFQLFKAKNVSSSSSAAGMPPDRQSACCQCGCKLRLRLLHTLTFQPFLLLERRKLALQRDALVVNRAQLSGIMGRPLRYRLRQRVEQWRQGVNTLLYGAVSGLILLPARNSLSRSASQAASVPSSGTFSDSALSICSSVWRVAATVAGTAAAALPVR
jgi:hypothetical protein